MDCHPRFITFSNRRLRVSKKSGQSVAILLFWLSCKSWRRTSGSHPATWKATPRWFSWTSRKKAYVDHNFLREVCLLVQQQQKFWFLIYSKFGQKWLLSTLIIAVGFSISSFYHTSCQINLLLLEFLHSTEDDLHTSRCGKPEAAVDGSRVTLVNFNHGRSHSALPSLRNSFALAQTQTWLTERQKKRKNTGEYYSHQTADVLQELADHLTFFCINCHLGGVLASQSCTKMFSLWKCAPRYFTSVDKQNY